ncbi:4'-phosphopantetheinyl transferase family protein [Schumannella soli]|uniref:4-phosphopantetheinyl transferase family protein n=1 Tax=Schumannella soli TaxID=2590779 RepID=A0A506XYV4_9MICO|nr:4'-phosphopantetheinyl transferase superfamily protein [Schumannella soli]TPW75396.1 4-phosphopantetheinyl transferase family protein [Schumannella soli]
MDALRELDAPDGVRVVVLAAPDDAEERRAVGHDAAKQLVAELAGVRPESVMLDALCSRCGIDHGRPTAYLVSAKDASTAAVSITHTGGFTIVAASIEVDALGIDAELQDTRPDRVAAIDKIAPGRGDPMRRWTRIEAVLKADGRGLRVDPRHVRFLPTLRGSARARIDPPGEESSAAWHVFDLDDPELVVALALP